jgi:hypothetical protein
MSEASSGGNYQRRLPACRRCRSRKTKCDTLLPSCSNCVKAGVECVNNDRILGRAVSRSYLWSLEEQRAQDGGDNPQTEEAADQSSQRKRRRTNSDGPPQAQHHSPESPERWSSGERSDTEDSPSPIADNRHTVDALLVSTLGEGADVNEDLTSGIRQYSGSGGGRGDREKFIERENMAVAKLGRDFLKQGRKNITRNRVTDFTAYSHTMLSRLAKRYFTWMNSAHPVMHECMFHLQMENYRSNSESVSHLDAFQVNMVMAISLASISRPHLSTSEIGRIAHEFWKKANKSLNQALSVRGIQKLQNILLMLQYTLLVPKAGNLWQLCGSAMRSATEMGLHTEPNPSQAPDPLSLDLRRRVFWTCYCIDRILATVMGRPTGVADDWITTEMPALVEDRNITVNGIHPGPTCQLKAAQVQQVRICLLQSEIHGRLYAASKKKRLQVPTDDLELWSWQMYDQLRLWRNTFEFATPLITKEWTELQFHISIVLLFRPSPNRPHPSYEALHVAFHSAGEAMRLVKLMHRDLSAVFSWLTVQNLFMCGLTFVNSLKELVERQTPRGLCIPSVEVFLQIQACSSMLETMSSLEAGSNERIRNVFEMASSNVLHSLSDMQPNQRSQGCVWAQIAKSDNLAIRRPANVIPLQNYSDVLEECNTQGLGEHAANSKHFLNHDIDAAPTIGMLDSPVDASLYIPTRNNRPHHHQEPHVPDVPNYHESPKPITPIVQQSEPPRNSSEMPNWSDEIFDEELERWFLYPFPEVSPPLSAFSDQLSID